jgi:hypothetical protein
MREYRIELWRWFSRVTGGCYGNYVTWHGFDIIKFDKEVVKSGDRRCRDVIKERWGNVAANIIEGLAKTPTVISGESEVVLRENQPGDLKVIRWLLPMDRIDAVRREYCLAAGWPL